MTAPERPSLGPLVGRLVAAWKGEVRLTKGLGLRSGAGATLGQGYTWHQHRVRPGGGVLTRGPSPQV